MSSPLSSKLANAFRAYLEKNCLQSCLSDFKPHYYRRYVDDIFVLFTSLSHLETFRNLLNGQHVNMSFSINNEKQNRMSFLHAQIYREDKSFTTSVYRKPTFSKVCTHFSRFLSSTYKICNVQTFTYRSFRVYSSWNKLHTKLVCLKKLFLVNGYPQNFINNFFKRFLDNLHVVKETTLTV